MIDYRKARWQGFKVYHAAAIAVDEIDPASPIFGRSSRLARYQKKLAELFFGNRGILWNL